MTNRNEPLGGKQCPHGEPFSGVNCWQCNPARPSDPLDAPAFRGKWQPIATAPKDGTHILVVSPRIIPTPAHWFEGAWHKSADQRGGFSEYIWDPPTHWMLLPETVTLPIHHGAPNE